DLNAAAAADVASAAESDPLAAEPPPSPLDRFLQDSALRADSDSRRDEAGLVTLMTMHNAKGLEYPIVFIAACEEGVFPHSRALDEGGIEEERRLFYVGITRAMRKLYLTYARSRRLFGDPAPAIESSFIEEIPSALVEFDEEQGRLGSFGGPSPRRRAEFAGAWAAMAGGRDEVAARAASGVRARDLEAPRFRLGEDIVHAAFGEGVVTGVEPDGVIVVRFAGDGSERKLVAEYAPLSRR
ncbi:MAG: 3'-5' exonuclease, partial [Solirubrobacteraceae bacterium]